MKILPTVLLVLFGFFLLALLVHAPTCDISLVRKAQAKNDVTQLRMAMQAYVSEYSEPPKGDRAGILKALQEDNPRHLVFLEISPKKTSKDGLFIDPWGSPYVFACPPGSQPWAYSLGKNKTDEGGHGDDVTSWD